MAALNRWASGNTVEAQNDEPDHVTAGTRHRRRPLSLTAHGRRRGARRNVAPEAVDYVLAHGRMIQRTGVTFCFLGRRDMPTADRSASWASRLEGTIVLMAADGVVITVYRNRRGLRAIHRKLKYRIPDLNCRMEEADVTPADAAQWATA